MEQIILISHVLIALGIVGLILLQQGKGASMGASFGAGSSQTVLGSQGGGNLLTKATAVLATLFFVTSFALAVTAKEKAISAGLVDMPVPAVVESPAQDMPAAQQSTSSDDIPLGDMPAADVPAGDMPAESDVPSVE